jgi:tetratricopeptide (TPR) repeat protein
LVVVAFLIAITWAVFGQTFHHQFINYDDPLYVYDNAHIRAGLSWPGIAWAFTHIHSQNWHPLTTMSHMLDCQLFGVNPGAHHLVNVFWHSVTVALLFVLLTRMTGAVWPSAFVAAIFAIHPLRVESVAWIAERKDVLSGTFFMLTLLSYFSWTRKPTFGRYFILAILFACGLMSKPILVTTPIVLLLLDYWPLNRSQRSEVRSQKSEVGGQTMGKLIVEKIPLFALSAGSVIATLWAQNFALGSTQFLPLSWRISNALFSYFEYVRQMFWPANLIPFYVHPENRLQIWQLAIAIVILIFVTAVAVGRRRQNPYLIVGWLWYLVTLLPVIGIVQVGLQGHADRYTYLPEIGLVIALVWWIWDLTNSFAAQKIILISSGVALVATLSILSAKQTTYWRDTESLWRHALAVTPDSDVALTGLGGILSARGAIDDAIDDYEHALRLRDGNVAAHFGLARALAAKQKTDAAISHLQKALEIQPDYIAASNDLGVLLASKGEITEAIAAWRQTLSFDPENADAANNIAWVRSTAADASLRDGKEALELAQRAIRSGGENAVVLRTLAAAQAENDQFAEAIATCQRGEESARRNADQTMAESLRLCAESFRRGEPLRGTQVAH